MVNAIPSSKPAGIELGADLGQVRFNAAGQPERGQDFVVHQDPLGAVENMKYIQDHQYNVPRLVAYSNTLTHVVALHEGLERRFGTPLCDIVSSFALAADPRTPRSLHQRLTPIEIEALVAAYRAGVRQPVLAERYGIGLTSVKKLIRLDSK